MSHALAALQQHVDTAAESFCRRSGQPPVRRRGKSVRHTRHVDPPPHPRPKIGKFYRPRDHEASPFFKIVRDKARPARTGYAVSQEMPNYLGGAYKGRVRGDALSLSKC